MYYAECELLSVELSLFAQQYICYPSIMIHRTFWCIYILCVSNVPSFLFVLGSRLSVIEFSNNSNKRFHFHITKTIKFHFIRKIHPPFRYIHKFISSVVLYSILCTVLGQQLIQKRKSLQISTIFSFSLIYN